MIVLYAPLRCADGLGCQRAGTLQLHREGNEELSQQMLKLQEEMAEVKDLVSTTTTTFTMTTTTMMTTTTTNATVDSASAACMGLRPGGARRPQLQPTLVHGIANRSHVCLHRRQTHGIA